MTMLSAISRISLLSIFICFNSNSVRAEDSAISKYVDMVKGSNTAPITLIEYASFTCPHCADFHKNVFPLITKEFIDTGKVRFIYREVYFDAPGLWAGLLARCTEKDKYFGITNLLFDKQKKMV
jgi:protein-disulfide isomerase